MEVYQLMKHNADTINLIKTTRKLYNTIDTNYKNKSIIGWEHELSKKELDMFVKLNASDSDTLLIKDLKAIDRFLNKVLVIELTQNQYNALVSLVYDIGFAAFRRSELLAAINNNKLESVPQYFKRWNTYLKLPIYRLTKVRKIEIELFTK